MTKYEMQYGFNGEDTIRFLKDTNIDKFFYAVSRVIAFQDCNDIVIYGILIDDKLIHYTGWQPDCVFTYADEDGNIVYENQYPQFDH